MNNYALVSQPQSVSPDLYQRLYQITVGTQKLPPWEPSSLFQTQAIQRNAESLLERLHLSNQLELRIKQKDQELVIEPHAFYWHEIITNICHETLDERLSLYEEQLDELTGTPLRGRIKQRVASEKARKRGCDLGLVQSTLFQVQKISQLLEAYFASSLAMMKMVDPTLEKTMYDPPSLARHKQSTVCALTLLIQSRLLLDLDLGEGASLERLATAFCIGYFLINPLYDVQGNSLCYGSCCSRSSFSEHGQETTLSHLQPSLSSSTSSSDLGPREYLHYDDSIPPDLFSDIFNQNDPNIIDDEGEWFPQIESFTEPSDRALIEDKTVTMIQQLFDEAGLLY